MKLYNVDKRALIYYKNIIAKKNKYHEIEINEDVLIKRITAMCYSGIKVPCKNKQGIKKIYCNGYKLTVDYDNLYVKYIAIVNESINDFSDKNKTIVNASMGEIVLNRLMLNYEKLGLNKLGLLEQDKIDSNISMLTEEEKASKYAYNVFLDIRHRCEMEYITDALLALKLCQLVYTTSKKNAISIKEENTRVNKAFYQFKKECEAEYITNPKKALRLCQSLYKKSNVFRNEKNKKLGLDKQTLGEKRTYITRVLQNEIGNVLSW